MYECVEREKEGGKEKKNRKEEEEAVERVNKVMSHNRLRS